MADTNSSTPSPAPSSSTPQSPSKSGQSPSGTSAKTSGTTSPQVAGSASPQSSQGTVNQPQGASSVLPDGQPQAKGGEETKKLRKYQIKVDGKASEVDLDSMSDEEIVKHYQMGAAAQRRMQEAAELRKNIESVIEQLKKDPINALKDPALGIDVRKMVEEQILREYEESQLSAPERRAKELERELAARDARLKEIEAKEQAAAQKAMEERVFQETQQAFVQALDEEGIPKTRESVYMMAEIARINLDHGIELTPRQMAAEVRNRIGGMHAHITKNLKGEALMKHLGDEVITQVLQYAVEQVKAQQNQQATQAFNPEKAKEPAKAERKSADPFADDEPKTQRRLNNLRDWRKHLKGG